MRKQRAQSLSGGLVLVVGGCLDLVSLGEEDFPSPLGLAADLLPSAAQLHLRSKDHDQVEAVDSENSNDENKT